LAEDEDEKVQEDVKAAYNRENRLLKPTQSFDCEDENTGFYMFDKKDVEIEL